MFRSLRYILTLYKTYCSYIFYWFWQVKTFLHLHTAELSHVYIPQNSGNNFEYFKHKNGKKNLIFEMFRKKEFK